MIGTARSYLLLLTILFASFRALAQPLAAFSISVPLSNCNPAIYSFVNASTGTGLTYQWNFGVYPGVNSIFQNPSTTYLNCGSFQVKLTVTDINGRKDSSIQTVSVRCSPTATFNTSSSSGCLPLSTNFTSTSIAGSGNISSYVWDFGDGNNGIGSNPSHTYLVPGCKNVTLIVTNSFNCTSDTTITNLLCAYQPPTSSFTSDVQSSCSVPLTVNYQATSSSGSPPYTYRWLFQGGTPPTSTTATPTVNYATAGSFNTVLVTTDAHGCSDTVTKHNYINVGNNNPSFTITNPVFCSNTNTAFNGASTTNPLTWTWSSTPTATISSPTAKNTNVVFPSAGTYNICLSTTYPGGCAAQKCSTITVNKRPMAKFGIAGPSNTCVAPTTVAFLDSSVGSNLHYSWGFASGLPSSSSSQNPTVTYGVCGHYSARLTITDDVGCVDGAIKTDFLVINCNQASYTVAPSNGCLPLTAYFNGSATGSPASWLWDFDDPNSGVNNSSTLQNPTHTYTADGCYTIKLTVTDSLGCVSSYSIPAGVCAGWRPHANFSANPPLNCANQPIYFTDSSTNTYAYTQYVWDFHGQPLITQSTLQSPSYIYGSAGIWDITLIVSNYGCADTITIDNLVHTLDPVSHPVAIRNCGNPLSVTLDGTGSHGAQRYKWIILGGTPDTANTPTVSATFPGLGDYNVSLLVTNDTTGCSDLENVIVHITDVGAQFVGSPLNGCQPMQSCFSNTSTNAVGYDWRVYNHNGVLDTTASTPSPCFKFNNAGLYSVQLIVRDTFGCIDTLYKPDYIKVSHPVANFAATPLQGCAPLAVNFQDTSLALFANLTKWKWQFGDSISGSADSSHLQNPNHVYANAGSYTIALSVTDSNGCTSDTVRRHYIQVNNPSAHFIQRDSSSCNGKQSCFTINPLDTSLHYHWDFGDGTVSDTANNCHTYSSAGTFNISLVATDALGCSATASAVDSVVLFTPHPDFVADTTTTACPPLLVNFSNLSTGIDSSIIWNWDFGDGQVSFLKNPSHIYTSAGHFTVTLVAKSVLGCTDTLTFPNYIVISGPTAYVSTAPTSGCVPHATCMSATSTFANTFTWNMGDGMVMAGTDSTCYTYTRSGTFYPELILSNGSGCIFSLPMGRVDVGGSVAKFIPDKTALCQSGSITFTDSSFGTSGPASWDWDFGDPNSGAQNHSTLQNPSHYYSTNGLYHVTEHIVSVDGCIDSTSTTITVNNTLTPTVALSAATSCGANTISFTQTTSTGILNHNWNFGDTTSSANNTSTIKNPSHYFSIPGTYHVTYLGSDSNGCSANFDTTITIYPQPVAAFSINDACFNRQSNSLVNNSQVATNYVWNFGDGAISILTSPTHNYADTGTYIVSLIAQTNFCNDTMKKQVSIFPVPVASFDVPTNTTCGTPASFTINNNSIGATLFNWDLGNNTTSALPSPANRYDSIGHYTILLTARNIHGCSDTTSKIVIVNEKPHALIFANDTCLNTQPITFGNITTAATAYLWNFGDGNTSSQFSPSHNYTDTGAYNIQLIAGNNYCNDTATLVVKIFPLPIAVFDVSTNSICGTPANFTLTNTSNNATNYQWDFGNSTFSSLTNPTANYTNSGEFNILLTAINQYHCIDTTSKKINVFPKPLIQGIDIGPYEGCQPLTVLLNASVNNASSYAWDFGSHGKGANLPLNPIGTSLTTATYVYPDTGSFTVTLYTTSINQCTDTMVLKDTVKVHAVPVAAFDTFTNSSVYPFDGTVVFTNHSVNANNYIWDFGDGNYSNEINPQHKYEQVNDFNVMLVSSTNYNCSDTTYKRVHIFKKSLYVPNALEPDHQGGDELVKVWKPLGIGLLTYHAQVFNQWGQLLWESQLLEGTQPTESWDGNYDGKPCAADVYVWKIDAVFVDGTIWKGMNYSNDEGGGTKTIGSITLVR